MKTRGWWVTLALPLALSCNGKLTVYEVIINGGGPGVSDGGALDGAMTATGGDALSAAGTRPSAGGVAAGGVAAGGVAGDTARAGEPSASGGAGDLGGAGTGGALGLGGASDADAGAVPCDTLIPDLPANCHATVACTGAHVIDQTNAPRPTNLCLVGTCNASGVPGTAPAAAETPCRAAGGAKLCDGAGQCVACLHASDCPDGQICSVAAQCVAATCTDVDCGGACPPCGSGKKCLSDADCSSFACDVASLTCITQQCQDHQQDGLETDADCGGGFCKGCVLGKGCLVNEDCASSACDAITLTCITSRCRDHRTDYDETDIDCGGGSCQSCTVGQNCKTTFDCPSGHVCNSQKVCQ